MLNDKIILLGITGSIAAYKSVDIVRRLIDEGADVNVVMTESACRFIPPYTLETVTGNKINTDLFGDPLTHIKLPEKTDLFLIAPVTANTINKLSNGIADNLIGSIWLAYKGPVLMAPSMNFRMYRNPVVQENIKKLKKMGVQFIGPETGSLACGDEGEGRMVEVSRIIETAVSILSSKDLSDHNIIVTAGPTLEPIDPVRFISNRSSGRMGYAIASAAMRRGAEVTLISGPTSLAKPEGVHFVQVEKSSEMEAAVLRHFPKATSVIMAAAVSDFSPTSIYNAKHKKTDIKSLKLKQNTDILAKLGKRKGKRILIGFAAETGRDIKNAKNKLRIKNLDMIVLNDILKKGAGFNTDTNIVTLIDKKGNMDDYPLMKKTEVADIILDKMLQIS